MLNYFGHCWPCYLKTIFSFCKLLAVGMYSLIYVLRKVLGHGLDRFNGFLCFIVNKVSVHIPVFRTFRARNIILSHRQIPGIASMFVPKIFF